MPADFLLKAMNAGHRAIMATTGGRIGWSAVGMPVLELTTIGRRSGQPRSVMLTAPWHDEHRYALVASAGGNDHHPAWFLNLRETPTVTVKTDSGTVSMKARIVDDEERNALWPLIVSSYKGYQRYQAKTDRVIPVVMLEPLE